MNVGSSIAFVITENNTGIVRHTTYNPHCMVLRREIDEVAALPEAERPKHPAWEAIHQCGACTDELIWVIQHNGLHRRNEVRHT